MVESASADSSSAASARFAARVAAGEAAERLAAEAWAAGAAGIEERPAGDAVELLIYAPAARAEAVRDAVTAAAIAQAVAPVEPVPDVDWSEAWRRGLGPLEISPRLLVRPSFAAAEPRPGQHVLVVDPGQAFGTGTHESTQLVLAWIDALRGELPAPCRVLDVGTGTGLLALAAVALLSARCVGCDVDPRAAEAARANAAANGLAASCDVFCGSLDALGGAPFDLVVANLLKREMLPLLAALAAHTAPGGAAVLSGLLASEAGEVTAAAAAAGLRRDGERTARDASGEVWTALLMRR